MFELQKLDQKVKYDFLLVSIARSTVTPSGISQWRGRFSCPGEQNPAGFLTSCSASISLSQPTCFLEVILE